MRRFSRLVQSTVAAGRRLRPLPAAARLLPGGRVLPSLVSRGLGAGARIAYNRGMLRRILGRPGFSIALVAGVALAALFFLPWLRVVSLGVEVGSATGLELAQGEITTRLATLGGDAVEPRPWFWLGAAIPVPLVAIGAVGSTRPSRRRRAGSALLALSVAGGGVALLALGVTYGRITVVEPEPTNWLWACVGLNGLAALGGLVELAVGLAAGERRSPASRPKRRRTS